MKLKAFTVLEIIIVLVLTSVIVSMMYAFFLFMSKSTNNYLTNSTENMLIQIFYSNLKREAFISEEIVQIDPQSFYIQLYSGDMVYYIKKGPYLFRNKNNQRDSIKVKSLSFETKVYPLLKDNELLIESIQISASLFENEIPLGIYKNYFSKYPNFK